MRSCSTTSFTGQKGLFGGLKVERLSEMTTWDHFFLSNTPFPPLTLPLLCVSGILRTAVPDMDRETQDQYLVLLQAKDMGGHLGGLSGTTTVTVKLTDVNDNPPRFTQSESPSGSRGHARVCLRPIIVFHLLRSSELSVPVHSRK